MTNDIDLVIFVISTKSLLFVLLLLINTNTNNNTNNNIKTYIFSVLINSMMVHHQINADNDETEYVFNTFEGNAPLEGQRGGRIDVNQSSS